jgi:hypothetical protein
MRLDGTFSGDAAYILWDLGPLRPTEEGDTMTEPMAKRMTTVENSMSELRAMFRRTMVTVAQMKGDLAELKDFVKENMATKADISALNGRMDGFSGLLLDSRQRWDVHADALKRHHESISALEGKQP